MKKNIFTGKNILITGGTGSFGKEFARIVLSEYSPRKLVVYSRDEMKQFELQGVYEKEKRIKFVIGDVRDKQRLALAMKEIDYIVHAAALKIVPAMECNPSEAVRTNILGAMNIIEAALEQKVKKVIALSTDKACNPINLYGATKLCSDKLFVAANSFGGRQGTKFAIVRYGNVVGSRGSVVPFFREKRKTGVIPITDKRMTRFWITLEQGVRFVLDNFVRMQGGELFIPKIPSMKIIDLAKALAPECRTKVVGIRQGEKIHEVMVSSDDARNTFEYDDYFVIAPNFDWWRNSTSKGRLVAEDFCYSSDGNRQWLTKAQLKNMIEA